MAIFRGSRGSTVASGEIVATTTEIVEALNAAIAAKDDAEEAQSAAELAQSNAETAESGAEDAQQAAENAQSSAETAQSNAEDAQSYAEEWANKPEDSLVSSAAGGDGIDDFSALHWSIKSSDSAAAAATSASEALTSEQNALQSATDAETALDTFTDLYLGSKTSDPATDNDGDPLQDGALYYNSTDGNLKVYSLSLDQWVQVFKSDAEIRDLFSASGDLNYISSTGEFSVTTYKSTDFDTDFGSKSTDDLTEGTNLYYTDARVESYLSGGTGVDFSSGVISIGQPVGTGDSVTFVDAEFTGTGAVELPEGTEAQRPGTPATGMIRFNSDATSFEGYNGIEWGEIGGGGGATGGGTDQVFYENDQIVTTNYTIEADKNAMTTGPIDIDNGVTVTVETGARWVVI